MAEHVLLLSELELNSRANEIQSALKRASEDSDIHVLRAQYHEELVFRLGKSKDTQKVQDDRGADEEALYISGAEHELAFSFSERWRRVDAKSKQLRFMHSRIRFYFAKDGKSSLRQFLRFEWEAKTCTDEKEDLWIFDGNGAAHPHIQVDRFSSGEFESVASSFVPVDGPNAAEPAISENAAVSAESPWFQKLHLPLRTTWHAEQLDDFERQVACHQHLPASAEELANWLSWSIAYVKREVEKYAY